MVKKCIFYYLIGNTENYMQNIVESCLWFLTSSPLLQVQDKKKKKTTYRKSNTLLHIFMDCVFFKFYEILLFCREVENHSKIFALILIL